MSNTPTISHETMDASTRIPEHIREQTESILGTYPTTNRAVVLENARWFYRHGGSCAIYRYHVHYLDCLCSSASADNKGLRSAEQNKNLENDNVRRRVEVFTEAREQAREIGLNV